MSTTEARTARVPLAEVGRTGRMDLVFAAVGAGTELVSSYCEVPFKITRVIPRVLDCGRTLAHLVVMHSTAGLFGGDEIRSTIRVESRGRALITQQAATQVHPARTGTAGQSMSIAVCESAELHLDLEPVIPFRASRFRQETRITLASGARMSAWDGFTAGRTGRGERWLFEEFGSETSVRLKGRQGPATLYLDRFMIRPDGRERSAWSMGAADYAGTGLYYGADAPDRAARLHAALPECGVDCPSAGLLVLRTLARTGPEFHRTREIFRQIVLNS